MAELCNGVLQHRLQHRSARTGNLFYIGQKTPSNVKFEKLLAHLGVNQSEAPVPAIAQFLLKLTRSRRQDSLSIGHKISVVDAFGRPTFADLPA